METAAHPLSKKQLERYSMGLFIMTLFTCIWATIAEIALMSRDHGATAGAFIIVIIFFVINYFRLAQTAKEAEPSMLDSHEPIEKSRKKKLLFMIAIESIAIFAINNILTKTGHGNLFVPFFALLAGFHFFPMGFLLKRLYYYILGAWMCLMAGMGFILINMGAPADLSAGIISLGCALATTANAIRIIKLGGAAWLGGM